jgi:hypothetical protein
MADKLRGLNVAVQFGEKNSATANFVHSSKTLCGLKATDSVGWSIKWLSDLTIIFTNSGCVKGSICKLYT